MRCLLTLLLWLAAPALAQPAEPAPEPAIARPCREAAEARPPQRRQIARCDRTLRVSATPPPLRLAMLMNRGVALLNAGRLDAAAADFDLAIKAAPGLPEAWINKGVALTRLPGRSAEAVALISHGLSIGPKEPARAYFARAQAHEGAGQLREAMEDYAAAARADPSWPAPGEELKRFRIERRKVLRG
jgi:tetratricopeptide (TPR) repeat protein